VTTNNKGAKSQPTIEDTPPPHQQNERKKHQHQKRKLTTTAIFEQRPLTHLFDAAQPICLPTPDLSPPSQ
ncbi:hypothetical protein ACJMK2_005186, partial [Sinanodonta woodiana]